MIGVLKFKQTFGGLLKGCYTFVRENIQSSQTYWQFFISSVSSSHLKVADILHCQNVISDCLEWPVYLSV